MADYLSNAVVPILQSKQEIIWLNSNKVLFQQSQAELALNWSDLLDASQRLSCFAPYLAKVFAETTVTKGIIESQLKAIPKMQAALEQWHGFEIPGRLWLKCDHQLPVAGSIKARGGFYEVLLHAETLALANGLLRTGDNYRVFNDAPFKQLFAKHKIVVGSTGNLGLSIGMMGAQLGFQVIVHMSADAREWKKNLLKSKGVQVVEHQSDYSIAVAQGREQAMADAQAYFIDDEDSRSLFLGYSVAALRLKAQLAEQDITVDAAHPLLVYLPCGVGGAPGGITFGLKQVFGDYVHCFFVEPTHSPCMLLGMATGLQNKIAVQDIGLNNQTCADGLAVGRPSAFVGSMMMHLLSGIVTVSDENLYRYLTMFEDSEHISLEPSATAGIAGVTRLLTEGKAYLEAEQLTDKLSQATHIIWATGGQKVPHDEHKNDYQQGLVLLGA
ncbi:D-serine ammonia-lyase [Agarivorans sp. QJM3NY_33]|uniref:D-serine ammonia-lyase n=1 Tax=Agarivorans sp. QJM3NY_33 TaxID=3421432 RepID=UPI003D7C8227